MEFKIESIPKWYDDLYPIRIVCNVNPNRLDGWKTIKEKVVEDVPGKKYRLFVEENDGICRYGATQLFATRDDPYGYTWTSRPSSMNKNFGTKLCHVLFVDKGYFAIDSEKLKPMVEEFLGEKVEIKTKETKYDVFYWFEKVGE